MEFPLSNSACQTGVLLARFILQHQMSFSENDNNHSGLGLHLSANDQGNELTCLQSNLVDPSRGLLTQVILGYIEFKVKVR